MDYREAVLMLNIKPNVEPNTVLVRRSPTSIAVQFYATDVVTFHANGDISLNSGGYRTVSTKNRINAYTDAKVHAIKRVWHVNASKDGVMLFEEGMMLKPDGTVRYA